MNVFLQMFVYTSAFLCGVLLVLFFQMYQLPSSDGVVQHATVVETQKQVTPAEVAEKKVVTKDTIRFTGDIMIARNVENLMNSYGYFYPFSQLLPLATSSYLVGNFESAIPEKHVPTKSLGFSFSVNQLYLQGLQEYGFTHLGVANNHSYDFGSADFKTTVSALEKAQLQPFGDQRQQASSTIRFITLPTETVALVGVFAVDVAPTTEEIQKLLLRASKESDIQIVYIHFGTEYQMQHSPYQERVAHTLIDSGADVVIGHHPHVVEDIELYKGKLIFYSLGNFIFDQYFSQEVQEGLVVDYTLENEMRIFTLIPVTSIGSRSAPRFMEGYERDTFLETLAVQSDAELSYMIQTGKIVLAK